MTKIRKRGDILEATDRAVTAGRHYIIYYDGIDDINFVGGMITHTQNNKNKPMKKSHFNNNHKIKYDNTNLVVAKLVKFESWGPFTKVGELSQEGVEFVVNTINNQQEETWPEYCNRTKTQKFAKINP